MHTEVLALELVYNDKAKLLVTTPSQGQTYLPDLFSVKTCIGPVQVCKHSFLHVIFSCTLILCCECGKPPESTLSESQHYILSENGALAWQV